MAVWKVSRSAKAIESVFCQTKHGRETILQRWHLNLGSREGRDEAHRFDHQAVPVGRSEESLTGIGVEGITVSDVRGFGRQKGHTEVYRGAEYAVDFLPKIQITILASDDLVPEILEAITEGARTGKIGDGKIFITALEEVIRIRTGKRGEGAL
jgi:nitrogen regulatory protein PII